MEAADPRPERRAAARRGPALGGRPAADGHAGPLCIDEGRPGSRKATRSAHRRRRSRGERRTGALRGRGPCLLWRGGGTPSRSGPRARDGYRAESALAAAGKTRPDWKAAAALRSAQARALQLDERPVFARVPLLLRVLRRHRAVWPRAARQVCRADALRIGRIVWRRLARAGLLRRRQLHRQPPRRGGVAA